MEENLKNQLDQISNSIDSKIEKSNNEVANTIEVKASEIVKSEVNEMSNKLNERFDAFEVANKKQFNANKKMTFKGALSEAIEKELRKIKGYRHLPMLRKALQRERRIQNSMAA